MASEEGLSVTLKRRESERYAGDGSWMVFHGSPRSVRENISATFGIDWTGKTLVQLVTEAERLWRSEDSTKIRPVGNLAASRGSGEVRSEAVTTVVNALDGEVISEEKTDDPWKDATPATNPPAAEEPSDPVLAAIKSASSKSALQAVYLAHKERFGEKEINEAAKAKAAELDG